LIDPSLGPWRRLRFERATPASGCKLLRCGRCRSVWFCTSDCQAVAARQGHSGANCRPADEAPTTTDAEVAPRVTAATGPSSSPPQTSTVAPAASSCHACGKTGDKLLRCGQCKNVWFCNRRRQIVAARQGHSGINCRAADGAPTRTDGEVVARVSDAAEPRSSPPLTSTVAPDPAACHACSKSGCKLLLCGRCRNAWFCSRECQVIARKELGHKGTNCRRTDVRAAAPVPRAELIQRFMALMGEAH